MTDIKQVEHITTQCNQLVEKAGFDPETHGVGFDRNGTLYAIIGDDMSTDMNEFFEWIEDELPEDQDYIHTLHRQYTAK